MPKKNIRPSRKTRPVLHIFCEGEKTEPNYIKDYLEKFFDRRTIQVRVEPTKKNTPKQLVDEAVKAKRTEPDGDQYWVVYDRESTAKYPAALHAQARDKAKANGIGIALSNVCFEVWLLLHFQNSVGPFQCCDDLLRDSGLKSYLPNYAKGDYCIFESLEDKIDDARANAKRLNQNTIAAADPSWSRPDQWNPYTNVVELLDAIDAFAKA